MHRSTIVGDQAYEQQATVWSPESWQLEVVKAMLVGSMVKQMAAASSDVDLNRQIRRRRTQRLWWETNV